MNVRSRALVVLGNLLLATALAASASALAQSDVRTVELGDIDRVNFGARGVLRLSQGATPSLEIHGRAEQLERLLISQRAGELVISDEPLRDQRKYRRRDHIEYRLVVRDLAALHVGSHARVKVEALEVDSLWLTLASHADVTLVSLGSKALELRARSHAEVRIDNLRAPRIDVDLGSHAEASLRDIDGRELFVNLDSHADMHVNGAVDVQLVAVDNHGSYSSKALASEVTHIEMQSHASASVHRDSEVFSRVERLATLRYDGSRRGEPEHYRSLRWQR